MHAPVSRFTPSAQARPAPIHAEIIGDNTAVACGITVCSSSPILLLCRKLVEAGIDRAAALEAWRGSLLCLRIRSIGETARLEVNANGTGFSPFRAVRRASAMHRTAQPGSGQRPGRERAHGAPSRRRGCAMKHTASDAPTIIENGRLIGEFEYRMRAAAADENRVADPPPVLIKRYPTRLQVRCPACGHSATVTIMLDDVRKLKCRKCGRPEPNIGGRSP